MGSSSSEAEDAGYESKGSSIRSENRLFHELAMIEGIDELLATNPVLEFSNTDSGEGGQDQEDEAQAENRAEVRRSSGSTVNTSRASQGRTINCELRHKDMAAMVERPADVGCETGDVEQGLENCKTAIRSGQGSTMPPPVLDLMNMASSFGGASQVKAKVSSSDESNGSTIVVRQRNEDVVPLTGEELQQQWRDEVNPLPAQSPATAPATNIETRISLEGKGGTASAPGPVGSGPGAFAVISPGTRRVSIPDIETDADSTTQAEAEDEPPPPEPSNNEDSEDTTERSSDEPTQTIRRTSAHLIYLPAILSPLEDESTNTFDGHQELAYPPSTSPQDLLRNSTNTQPTLQTEGLDDDSNQIGMSSGSADQVRRYDHPSPSMLVDAKIVDDSDDDEDDIRSFASAVSPFNNRVALAAVICCLVSVVVVMALGVAGVFRSTECKHDDSYSETSNASATWSTLGQIQHDGALKCLYVDIHKYYYEDETTGMKGGFCSIWCEAVAAAILGPDRARVEYVEYDPDIPIEDLDYHISPIGITPTMTRNVYSPSSYLEDGAAFSTPFFYEAFQVTGVPFYVDCVQEKDFKHTEECEDLKMCVLTGSVHESFALNILPPRRVVVTEQPRDVVLGFVNGTCNLLLIKSQIPESIFRSLGYQGEYAVGTGMYGKGMWSLLTDSRDAQFADFVNAVVYALLVAEQHNITQSTANTFPQTDVFGPDYKDMFRHALAKVGNYQEIYQRHVEDIQPREPVNRINNGSTGLMYTPPIGQITATNEDRPLGPNLHRVLERGFLQCGVRLDRPGFAWKNDTTGTLVGMEIDFCKALASSLLEGDSSAVEYVELVDASDGYQRLANHEIDVMAGATWNLANDMKEPTTGQGFAFSRPYFFGYSAEEDNLCFATRQDDHDWATFVYWVLCATVFAEEEGIVQQYNNDMPLIYVYGRSFERIFRDAVLAVGNYGEIYERNLEELIPRSGRNLLNVGINPGPQLYPMPGLI